MTRLGGAACRPPWDFPYGRMGVVADDHGAVFMAPANNA